MKVVPQHSSWAGFIVFHLIYTLLLRNRSSPKLLQSCWIMKLTGLICLVIWVTKAGSLHRAESHNHNPWGQRHTNIERSWMRLSVSRDGQIQEEFSQRRASRLIKLRFCFFFQAGWNFVGKGHVWMKRRQKKSRVVFLAARRKQQISARI